MCSLHEKEWKYKVRIEACLATTRTLSQFCSFTICGTTLLNNITIADILIARLYNCERVRLFAYSFFNVDPRTFYWSSENMTFYVDICFGLLFGNSTPVSRFPTRFLNLSPKFLLAVSILILCWTYFWRSFATRVVWKSNRVTKKTFLSQI